MNEDESVVVAYTENGREIRKVGDHYEVQPRNDNYWIKVNSITEAIDAYSHPEKYR